MNFDRISPVVLSALRVVAGLLFLEHGLKKILSFPPSPAPAGAVIHAAHAALPPIMMAAGYIEIVGGILIALGLFGRFAAFICSGEMAFAYFMAHSPDSFFPVNNGGDAAILFCFVFLYVAFAGPGAWSLDALLRPKRDSAR